MSEALFLRLLSYDDKSAALTVSIKAAEEGHTLNKVVHAVNPTSFSQIPGSTFAYWVSEHIRRIFTELPAFESEGRAVKQGLATADDFRFIRLWWEVKPENTVSGTSKGQSEQFHLQTYSGKRWVPFAKGGAYSPYYSDIHLVVNWERDGEEIKARINPESGRPFSNVWQLKGTEYNYFFYPGLTWPLRTTSGISIRLLPNGCIFGHKGPTAFSEAKELQSLLALMNAGVFESLVALQLGAADAAARSYEVGLIQKVPVPDLSSPQGLHIGKLAIDCVDLKRTLDTVNETSHVFLLPSLLQVMGDTLYESITSWQALLTGVQHQLEKYQHEIDDSVYLLYGIEDIDRQTIEESLKRDRQTVSDKTEEVDVEDEEGASEATIDACSLAVHLLSYLTGCVYGRWDVRYSTGERSIPELPDPFAPLPICSPGMLTGDDGLSLHKTSPEYPININLEGILVDDQDHPDDIVRRVQDVIRIIWQDKAEAVEQEACPILRVRELREYFRKSGNGGFWIDHVRHYSKSRRKAPIYWLLQSSKRNYALWLYYHRLDKDTLFKALTIYVDPKIRLEEGRLEQIRTQQTSFGTADREAKQLERQIEQQENLMLELYDFRDKLRHVADLNLEPDLNDGVVLNIAPLWELVPWSEAKKYWEELLAGKYEWSSISKQLRERGGI